MTYTLKIGGDNKRSKFTSVSVEIDWDALPAESKEFAQRYGLKQWLQDGTVQAETQAQYAEMVATRTAKLLAADFTRTSSGFTSGPSDDPEVEGKKLARNDVAEMMKSAGIKADKEAVAKAAAAQFEAKKAEYVKKATAAIAARKESASAMSDEVKALLGVQG